MEDILKSLIYLVVLYPYWVLLLLLVIFLIAYFVSTRGRKTWDAPGSLYYNQEIEEASKYISSPERIDVYSENNNIAESVIMEKIGSGTLKAYSISGKTYVETNKS